MPKQVGVCRICHMRVYFLLVGTVEALKSSLEVTARLLEVFIGAFVIGKVFADRGFGNLGAEYVDFV